MSIQCIKCKEFKSFDDFYKMTRNTSGLSSDCKSCRITSVRKYQELNSEKILLKGIIYRNLNKEVIKSTTLLLKEEIILLYVKRDTGLGLSLQ